MRIAAVVLVGGQSRRFGTPKHLARLAGRTLLDTVIDRASSICDEVIVVGRHDQDIRVPDRASVVFDIVPGRGPLGGLHAGLHATAADRVLLLGCDMPFVSVPLLRYMTGLPAHAYVALAPRVGGVLQPLPAIYHRDCLPAIERLLLQDSAGLRRLLRLVSVMEIPEEQARRVDQRGLSTFSVNTPADFRVAHHLYREAGGRTLQPITAAQSQG